MRKQTMRRVYQWVYNQAKSENANTLFSIHYMKYTVTEAVYFFIAREF